MPNNKITKLRTGDKCECGKGKLKFKGFDMFRGWIFYCKACKSHTFSRKI